MGRQGDRFTGRTAAGELLAARLASEPLTRPLKVLALPRGGVPVAWPVARRLRAPLDVLVVRKIGMPSQPELAIGAIATGGVVLHNDELPLQAVAEAAFERVLARESPELERREKLYRSGKPPLELAGCTVVLVDDGLATGSTMRVAIRAARALGARQVVAAVPVASAKAAQSVRDEADRLVALRVERWLGGISECYDDFAQTTDEDVLACLGRDPLRDAPD